LNTRPWQLPENYRIRIQDMTDIQRTSTIKIVWGDGEHTFRLPYDQLVEHGEKLSRRAQ
jgi:hypothetical protein